MPQAFSQFCGAVNSHSQLPFRQLFPLGSLVGLFLFFCSQLGLYLHASGAGPFSDFVTIAANDDQSIILIKTGESQRKKLIFPVYRIAHYTDRRSGLGDILDYSGPKAVSMIFQRKIGGQRIEKEVKKAIRERVSSEEWDSLRDTATAFCKPYAAGTVDAGDVYSVVWNSEGWLISEFNGKEISRLQHGQFARALWSIWVGRQSLVNRADLLGDWAEEI